MARPLRITYPYALHHITSRGNNRQTIFLTDKDRRGFLYILRETLKKYRWLCHAYCLMPNHYHLLIETPESTLSQGMRHLNGVYTQKFNKTHARVGHVFQGRFKSLLVEKESYLKEVSRYIVLNPVRANIISHPDKWPWSSYNEIFNSSGAKRIIERNSLLSLFGITEAEAVKNYVSFIDFGINYSFDILKSIKRSTLTAAAENKIIEIAKKEPGPQRPALEELLKNVRDLPKKSRAAKIRAAYDSGYTFTEIAKYLGLHCATISRVYKK